MRKPSGADEAAKASAAAAAEAEAAAATTTMTTRYFLMSTFCFLMVLMTS